VPVPAQAAHIKTAGFSQGMVFSHYVRFEAPVDVCLAYAKQVAHGAELTPESPDVLDSIIRKDRPRFRDLSWFDLAGAGDLIGAHPGVFVWVDRARGVFYFFDGF